LGILPTKPATRLAKAVPELMTGLPSFPVRLF
jgi:hypothetical protein